MADFSIVSGDLLPVLTDSLVLPDGTAADLTGAAVQFHMVALAGGFRRGGAAAVVDALTGAVSYAWQSGDTNVPPGMYRGQWLVTYANTKPLHFPNDGYITIKVEAGT